MKASSAPRSSDAGGTEPPLELPGAAAPPSEYAVNNQSHLPTGDEPFSDAFLEHAARAPSQYDGTCRRLAAEVLRLRAEVAALRPCREALLRFGATLARQDAAYTAAGDRRFGDEEVCAADEANEVAFDAVVEFAQDLAAADGAVASNAPVLDVTVGPDPLDPPVLVVPCACTSFGCDGRHVGRRCGRAPAKEPAP